MDDENLKYSGDFDEYLRQSDPNKQERAESWKTAIGLQAVDGLKPSSYLLEAARRHIEGDITIDEVKGLIERYYQSKTAKIKHDSETEEADKASANIAKLLNEKTFSFSPVGYIAIHRRIFEGVFKFAGEIRNYNITKKEWVLRGDTVLYAGADEIRGALEHDFSKESEFDYKGLSLAEMVIHFTKFISNLWQIHPFGEGNTRTTAVFAIKYLRAMGFEAGNDLFADNSWYFRNALVRANYRNYQKGISSNLEYLELFFRNLLMNEQNELKNRYLLINAPEKLQGQNTPSRQIPDKSPDKSPDMLGVVNQNLMKLVGTLAEREMSVREMLAALELHDRENFLNGYLTPAIKEGFVRLLYPDKPKHPRQKYQLTVKGLTLYQELQRNENPKGFPSSI